MFDPKNPDYLQARRLLSNLGLICEDLPTAKKFYSTLSSQIFSTNLVMTDPSAMPSDISYQAVGIVLERSEDRINKIYWLIDLDEEERYLPGTTVTFERDDYLLKAVVQPNIAFPSPAQFINLAETQEDVLPGLKVRLSSPEATTSDTLFPDIGVVLGLYGKGAEVYWIVHAPTKRFYRGTRISFPFVKDLTVVDWQGDRARLQ